MGKIRKTTTYTKSIFNEILGISLKLRCKNNKPIIITKNKCEENYSYYKFVHKNNKYYLVFQIFNPRMYALTKDYHSDTCTLQININSFLSYITICSIWIYTHTSLLQSR